MDIERHGADGAEPRFGTPTLPRRTRLRCDWIVVAEAARSRKLESALPGQQSMAAALHDLARDQHWVAHATDRGYGAECQIVPRHHGCIHLRFAAAIEHRSSPCIDD